MIWVVYAVSRRARGERGFWTEIKLDEEHAVEVVGLTPALGYFAYIIWKGSLGLLDAGVLLLIYATYLVILQPIPPKEHEEIEDTGAVPRLVLGLRSPWRALAVVGLFVIGGVMLYFTARPFLDSMIGLATTLGVSQFVFVQWVAPFLLGVPSSS
jgi:cation:H+ antiporter